MLSARSFSSICLSCRFSILASQLRCTQSRLNVQLAQSDSVPRTLGTSTRVRSHRQRREFSTTHARRSVSQTGVTPSSDLGRDEPPSSSRLSVDDSVRRARQLFGDSLPRGHLTDEEYVIYERLYGPPVFVDKAEDVKQLEVDETEVFEEELPDGSSVLLKRGEDGELEEIEVFDDVEEELERQEEDVEGEETMTEAEWHELREEEAHHYHQDVYERSRLAAEEDLGDVEDVEDDDFMRAHPLTVVGRSKPSPSTVFLPKDTFVDPVSLLLTRANHKHLAESASNIFGGPGLPHSSTTPAASQGVMQKPIPLEPADTDMGNIEADSYLAAVMPGTYAAVMGTLVEIRRRLGSPWIERLLRRKNGPAILDAGSGGASVIAWHEILHAEWLRMHEESGASSHGSTPLGKATVLTGSDTLRHRASRLLEDTTFIPRLPELMEEDVNSQQPRKSYDLIIAPHTLWSLKQEYLRKELVEKYWSLLNPKGGVLIILEKGLPRGFEIVAAARQLLLDKHIASPNSTEIEARIDEQVSSPEMDTRYAGKETGMIIAPCTNHSTCPMYQSPGISQGRKDYCFFSQRFIRPPYLQRILNAKDRNHEDVQYSYIAVQRGRDQRLPLHDPVGKGVVQNEDSTTAAFEGHEWKAEDEVNTAADVNTLSLPRLILPPLKRRGHIVLDVCTPAGRLERWTVPRSFSKQGFRDARKAQWGDLWALGAKTRIPRNVRLGQPRDEFDKKGRRIKAPKSQVIDVNIGARGVEGFSARRDGKFMQERKIRGSGGRKGRKKDGRKGERDVLDELD